MPHEKEVEEMNMFVVMRNRRQLLIVIIQKINSRDSLLSGPGEAQPAWLNN